MLVILTPAHSSTVTYIFFCLSPLFHPSALSLSLSFVLPHPHRPHRPRRPIIPQSHNRIIPIPIIPSVIVSLARSHCLALPLPCPLLPCSDPSCPHRTRPILLRPVVACCPERDPDGPFTSAGPKRPTTASHAKYVDHHEKCTPTLSDHTQKSLLISHLPGTSHPSGLSPHAFFLHPAYPPPPLSQY